MFFISGQVMRVRCNGEIVIAMQLKSLEGILIKKSSNLDSEGRLR